MNPFQYLALSLLLILSIITVRAGLRGRVRRRIVVFWLMVWVTTAICAAWPRATVLIARAVGIGRGTDLVLYCSVLITLIGFFYIYSRFRRVEHDLTLLVRQLAVRDPVLPLTDPSALTGAPAPEQPESGR